MLEELQNRIAEIKQRISPQYLNPGLRQQVFTTIYKKTEDQQEVFVSYINLLEQSYESYMNEVESLVQCACLGLTDYQNNCQSMSQEIQELNKIRTQQNKQNKIQLMEVQKQIKQLQLGIIGKQEEIRFVQIKLQERQTAFQTNQKDMLEYLKKIQQDFIKQQKALQQSCLIIQKLQRQNQNLRNQNQELKMSTQAKTNLQLSRQKAQIKSLVHQSYERAISIQGEISDQEHHSQEDLVRCSLISSNEEGLSQFEQIHQNSVHSSLQGTLEQGKFNSLKQMLSLSMQKDFKGQWGSVQNRSKENYAYNEESLPKQDKDNQNFQYIKKTSNYDKVQEFRLCNKQTHSATLSPYFYHFVLVSQNAKINSGRLQEVYNVPTDILWDAITTKKVPVHKWESFLIQILIEKTVHS